MGRRSPEREEFLSSIIITAVEGGTGYWAQVSRYKWEGLPDKDVHAVLHEMTDGDDPERSADGSDLFGWYKEKGQKLDISEVAKAIGLITRGEVIVGEFGSEYNRPLGDYAVKTIREASAENDGGMIDSNLADIIAQVALLGIMRYG